MEFNCQDVYRSRVPTRVKRRRSCIPYQCTEKVGDRCIWDRSGLMTGEEWHELTKKTEALITYPDAWGNSSNISWSSELITYVEYCVRRSKSTCIFNPEFVTMEMNLAYMTHTKPVLPEDVINTHIDMFRPRKCYVCGREYKIWHEECSYENILAK